MITINFSNVYERFDLVVEPFDFPSGCETHIKLGTHYGWQDVVIDFRPKKTEEIIQLLLVTDALKRLGYEKIKLFIPYLPFARQDRVMIPGEPLSIKVFCDLINSQEYSSVEVFDCHSEVGLALLNHVKAHNNYKLVEKALIAWDDYYIVCPDAGAYKKIFGLCQYLGYKDNIVLCNKHRNVSNGVIESISCDTDSLNGRNCIIVDDICDGGGTFVMLADELYKRKSGEIALIVSHGIFSKGIDVLKGIDFVYCSDSYLNNISHGNLTTFNLYDGLLS